MNPGRERAEGALGRGMNARLSMAMETSHFRSCPGGTAPGAESVPSRLRVRGRNQHDAVLFDESLLELDTGCP